MARKFKLTEADKLTIKRTMQFGLRVRRLVNSEVFWHGFKTAIREVVSGMKYNRHEVRFNRFHARYKALQEGKLTRVRKRVTREIWRKL